MQENLPLELLVCPQNHARLQVAEATLVERLNRAIAAGEVTNAAGRSVAMPIDGGLIREDGHVLYPIVDEIPLLLAEEAITWSNLAICVQFQVRDDRAPPSQSQRLKRHGSPC